MLSKDGSIFCPTFTFCEFKPDSALVLPKGTLPTGLLITGSLITGLFGVTISFAIIVFSFILGNALALVPNVLSAMLFSFEVFG